METKLTGGTPVADIVVRFPQTRTLLEGLGIDYCCGGKIPLNEAAEHAGLSADKVLEKLALAIERTEEDTASIKDWSSASSGDLVDHIEQGVGVQRRHIDADHHDRVGIDARRQQSAQALGVSGWAREQGQTDHSQE